jgi:hypothetical protein
MRAHRQPCRTDRLSFQRLENRRPLAGDVTMSSSAGTLLLVGDAADNGVMATMIGPTTMRVMGLPTGPAATPTTIVRGGERSRFFDIPVPLHVGCRMGDGADWVTISGPDPSRWETMLRLGSVDYAGEAGTANTLVIRDASIDGTIVFTGDTANDALHLTRVHQAATGALLVSAAGGADRMVVSGSSLGTVNVDLADRRATATVADLQADADTIVFQKVSLTGDFTAQCGVGRDVVSWFNTHQQQGTGRIEMGVDDDVVAVRQSTWSGDLRVALGHGINSLGFEEVTVSGGPVTGALAVSGGDGADTVVLTAVVSRTTTVATAGGEDRVVLSSCTADMLAVLLGAGTDILTLQAGLFGFANADGGDGKDTLRLIAGARPPARRIGFEIVSG